ncbi:mobilization protein, partial [Acinetobacter baumannii]
KYADRDDVRAVIDGNLPAWAGGDARRFFAAADANERKNGRAYLEVEAAIPREAADPVAWALTFAQQLRGERFPYRLAVHDREAGDGGRNVH